MTIYESLKSKNINELTEWFDNIDGWFDDAPWTKWWGRNYCDKCEPQIGYASYLGRDIEFSWCELNDKCRFFQDMDEILSNKEIIKMWLESSNFEAEY